MVTRSTVDRQSTLENLNRAVPKELTKSYTVGTTTNPPNQTQEEQKDLKSDQKDLYLSISREIKLATTNQDLYLSLQEITLAEANKDLYLSLQEITLAEANQDHQMDLYLSLSQEITLVVAISIGQKDLYLLSQEITLATTANQDHQMDLYLSLHLSLQEITLAEANQDLYLSLLQEITMAEANQDQMDLYLSLLQEITVAEANQDLYLSLLQEITLVAAIFIGQKNLYLSIS